MWSTFVEFSGKNITPINVQTKIQNKVLTNTISKIFIFCALLK